MPSRSRPRCEATTSSRDRRWRPRGSVSRKAEVSTVARYQAATYPPVANATAGTGNVSACLLVDGHGAGAAEPDVVLQGDPGALHLTCAGLAAQLPGEFGALGDPGGAQRVPLGDQAAGRVHDPGAAIGGGLRVDQLVRLTDRGHAQCLVGDELVGAEAVVQLDDVDV